MRLKGADVSGVRPTTERVRAAIFNILTASQYSGGRVLDLFAGTGSLGIEALSRGARWADFVERNRRQCAVIRDNLLATGYSGNAEVRQSDATRALESLPGEYSLVLLDPPYRMGAYHQVMESISRAPGLLTPDGMVVAGHSRQTELLAVYGALKRVILRQYGDNAVDIYRNEPDGRPGSDGEDPQTAAQRSAQRW